MAEQLASTAPCTPPFCDDLWHRAGDTACKMSWVHCRESAPHWLGLFTDSKVVAPAQQATVVRFCSWAGSNRKTKRGSRHEVGLQMGSQASHPSAPVSRPPPAQWPQADHLVRCMCAAALAVVTASTADLHRTGA